MKASDLFVKCLEEENIEYIFGVPGEENADFMISLEDSAKIKFVLTRHEQGAAFMAEIYGRLTGNPAACLGTLGPGATNLITGVADSNMDRAPMLVLTGQGSTERLHKESHQIMDVVKMFEPVTKWATTVLHPNTIPEIIRKAVRIARTEKPGAVHIELPEDIAKVDTDSKPIKPQRYMRSVPDEEVIDNAFEMIATAKHPIILVGNGVARKGASDELREFCELTKIGAMSTFMAKGCVDVDSEQCLFTIGLGSRDRMSYLIDQADVVITLGFDMVEYHPKLWNPNCDKKIIHADFMPSEIDQNYHPQIELVGDLAHTLGELNDRAKQRVKFIYDTSKQQKVRQDMLEDLAEHKNDDTIDKIRPQKAIWDARQVLGPDDILLSDVGAHKMWIARYFHCHKPNTCLIPNGFCSMGFALPGAIAANLVYPDRRVLGIAGDAGFLMNVQEMETAKRLNSNIVMMVWEDNEYGLIAWKQQAEFGKHTDLAFNNPDWELLAKSFGWNGYYVNNSKVLQSTLETAFNDGVPSLVVVPIDYRENMLLTKRLGELTLPM